MTSHEENWPPDRAEHPQEPAEGERDEVDAALDDSAPEVEREGGDDAVGDPGGA